MIPIDVGAALRREGLISKSANLPKDRRVYPRHRAIRGEFHSVRRIISCSSRISRAFPVSAFSASDVARPPSARLQRWSGLPPRRLNASRTTRSTLGSAGAIQSRRRIKGRQANRMVHGRRLTENPPVRVGGTVPQLSTAFALLRRSPAPEPLGANRPRAPEAPPPAFRW